MPKINPQSKDKCENCFFTGFEDQTLEIKCVRHPPTIMPLMTINPVTQRPETNFMSMMPTVPRNHWCGEHQYCATNGWFIKKLDDAQTTAPRILETITNDN